MSYLKADNLERFTTIDHGFGTAEDPWPEDIILLSQRHTNNVVIIDDEYMDFIPVADAMLTKLPDKVLGIKTADCLPILLYNPEANVVGVIHAGWRGLANMIIYNTIDKLQTFYNAQPSETFFSIGPGICKDCYEVGIEVYESINAVIDIRDAFKKTAKDKGLLDMRTIAQRELQSSGVPVSNISHINLCTKCSPNFYSHRAGSTGRQVSFIKIIK
ncbi:MAG: peptidoglycan editing factor PgeF [bacterium]